MDIVSRLKSFIDFMAFPVTQFADTATIPRPTLSQILNGRNKKISNEILDKLHNGFPNLNMMWLMFGDGEMTLPGVEAPVRQSSANVIPAEQEVSPQPVDTHEDSITEETQKPASIHNESAKEIPLSNIASQISLSSDASKKIQNIMVFYSDNSFEIFVPSNR